MSLFKVFRIREISLFLISSAFAATVSAYDGYETWLHYSAAPETMKSSYAGVCKSLVLCDELDTMKNVKYEFDQAMPKLIGVTLASGDGAGAIVCAPLGSPLVASAGLSTDNASDEGFIIKSSGGKTYISGKTQPGILRGVYHFLRLMQTGKSIDNLNITENPYFPYRVLDHWYNQYHSGSPDTERVYGGRRVYRLEDLPGSVSDANKGKRLRDYCRMAASLGLNGICPDNVNTYRNGNLGSWQCLQKTKLQAQKALADLMGTYGLKYYLSVSYLSPILVDPKVSGSSADATKTEVEKWWTDKVDEVSTIISNFGGFLMKADSEGEQGPNTYGITQAQGANPMARALKKHGYVLIWRTFIYGSKDPDFAVNQSMEFKQDAGFDDAIILRTKDGPRDFQTREPPNQLLALTSVRHGMEIQITQEYTGQAIHLCWLVPKWKNVLDYDMQLPAKPAGAEGTLTHQILRGPGTRVGGGGLWGISNFSDTSNWTGHFLHQANSYGFGRLAWNPLLSAEQIADEWIGCSFDNGTNRTINLIVKDMLLKSWKTYEDYTISYAALMGSLHGGTAQLAENHYEFNIGAMSQSQWFTKYFMNFTSDGIGVDRTKATGNNMVQYYPAALRDVYENRSSCPEELILFFHHLPWEYKMKSQMTLIQSLFYTHYRGIRQARNFVNNWKLLSALVDQTTIYPHVLSRLTKQASEAQRWFINFKKDFSANYKTAVACNLAIVTPDTNKAATTLAGTAVALSATLKDQNNAEVAGETIKWKLDPKKNPLTTGALSAAEGATVNFTATADGIYTVTASAGKWDSLYEDVQVFVGDFGGTGVAVGNAYAAKPALKITRRANGFVIAAPVAGKLEIVNLQGGVVKSASIGRPGVSFWSTRSVARGVYVIRFKNELRNFIEKVIVK